MSTSYELRLEDGRKIEAETPSPFVQMAQDISNRAGAFTRPRIYAEIYAVSAVGGVFLRTWATGREFVIGDNFRIAPLGNRTGHPTGRFTHYHRRIIGPDGKPIPGGSMKRHRPWDPPPPGAPWWRRF